MTWWQEYWWQDGSDSYNGENAQVRWQLLQQPGPALLRMLMTWQWLRWHDDKNIDDKMAVILTMGKMPRYVDSYCNNPDQLNLSAQEMLKPAVEVFSHPFMFYILPCFLPFLVCLLSFNLYFFTSTIFLFNCKIFMEITYSRLDYKSANSENWQADKNLQ